MDDVHPLLSRWRSEPEFAANVAAWQIFPARSAQYAEIPSGLHSALLHALPNLGICQLYSHQARAWEIVQSGDHLILATSTASGKTLAYNLPVIDRLLRQPEARALYLYPTKALAQDQLDEAKNLLSAVENTSIAPAVYDGDTPTGQRQAIRQRSRLVLSNPDMLHTGILPHHTAWAEFFRGLQFVVIDELHIYRGVFGSHVANVLRRLRRVARFYGAYPQFILASATIANPRELAEKLVEAPLHLLEEDGAARGEKHFIIYNPPIVDPDLGIRRSLLQETGRLAGDLLRQGLQTIIFGRARRTIELILAYLRQSGTDEPGEQSALQRIRGYRSGYLPHQRREIEEALRQGEAQLVVATSALELGIDIGGMQAAVLAGYPGTIASTWQQAGRAGRGADASLAVLVTSASPIDQFLAHNPQYLFARSPEQALVNPDNLLILLGHLRCAAFELPFQPGEAFGSLPADRVVEILRFLVDEGELHQSGERFFWMSDAYPAQGLSLRSASTETVLLHDEEGRTIGQVDRPSALWMVHPGAIYLHDGRLFQVRSLDLEGKLAQLKAATQDYYTEPLRETSVEVITMQAEAAPPGCWKAHGEVKVTTQVTGYRKVRWFAHEVLGVESLDLPPSEMYTTGYWLTISPDTIEHLDVQGLWNSSPNDYGPLWPAIRNRVRQRDGYRCQSCGAQENGKAHDVHHKIPFRSFHSAQEANNPANLVTLCPACHRKAESAVRVRSGLAGLAYVLGNLAPLFLMCDSGDLGVHAEMQARLSPDPQQIGQPAVILYDQVPAGIGFSERLYELHATLLTEAHRLVAACGCQDGCPSCVGPGGELGYGGKREALALLEALGA